MSKQAAICKDHSLAYDMIAHDTIIEGNDILEPCIGEAFDQAQLLRILDDWVCKVLSTDEPAFRIKETKHGHRVIGTNLAGGLRNLMRVHASQSHSAWLWKNHRFSPNLTLLFEALDKHPVYEWFVPDKDHNILNGLIAYIRTHAKSETYKQNLQTSVNKAVRNQRSMSLYIKVLLAQFHKLMVVRVDFTYKAECKDQITLETAQRHMAKLLRSRRTNKLFEHCVGYAWSLEYGERKGGYHFHCFFFFNGDKVKDHIFYGEQIGQCWIDATSGFGNFFNCNRSKIKYKRNGIGIVHYANERKCSNLIYAAGYLTKRQFFIVINPPETDDRKIRTFQHGELKKEGRKRGPLRKLLISN